MLINHGKKHKLLFPFLPCYSFDPNVNISILWHTILEWMKTSPLPETLFIQVVQFRFSPWIIFNCSFLQADNCVKENKNRYLFGFCCLMLKKGFFKKIMLSFLPVGHTHNDCDGLLQDQSDYFLGHSCESFFQYQTSTLQCMWSSLSWKENF